MQVARRLASISLQRPIFACAAWQSQNSASRLSFPGRIQPSRHLQQLSPSEMQQQYKHDGYVVVPQLLSHSEVQTILTELLAICRGQRGLIPGMDPKVAKLSDDEVLRHYLCVHFPHKMSNTVLDLLRHKPTAEVLKTCIGSPNVKAMQSMMFIKGPGKRGQATHQDEYYIPTRDRSLCAVWIALDHATVDNGCIWVVPGSHRHGIIWPMHPHKDNRFDASGVSYGHHYSENDFIPVELEPGSAVFFNGYLLHRSLPNVSKRYRRAFANHYMSAESKLPWTNDGRFDVTDDMRDIVLVSGVDPYAEWSPLKDITKPFLRAEVATSGARFNEVVDETKK